MPESGVSIVLAEDDQALAYALKHLLQHAGFEVEVTATAEAALERLAAARVLITDVRLAGELDGLGLLQAAKVRRPDLEVIVVTGHVSVEVAVGCVRAGAFDLLLKPFPDGELLSSVNRALERQRLLTGAEVSAKRMAEMERLAAMGEMAAGVAHEINNPMAFVRSNLKFVEDCLLELLGTVALLNEGKPAEALNAWDAAGGSGLFAEVQYAIEEAVQGADRISALVRDMRQVSRRDDSPRERTPLHELVESAVRLGGGELRACHVSSDLPRGVEVEVDRGRMTQALVNVLLNAAQAMAQSATRTLTLRARAEGSWIYLDVADTGPGIAGEVQARIFEPFFSTKRPGRGTGLGLSIARQTVTAHGGELTFLSRPGLGTTFTFRLPRAG